MATYHIEWQTEDQHRDYFGNFAIIVEEGEYHGCELHTYLRGQVVEEIEEQVGIKCGGYRISWQPYRL